MKTNSSAIKELIKSKKVKFFLRAALMASLPLAAVFRMLDFYFLVMSTLFIVFGLIHVSLSLKEKKVPLGFNVINKFFGLKIASFMAILVFIIFTLFFIFTVLARLG